MTTTSGRSISEGISRTVSTPMPEPINDSGNSRRISQASTLPDRTNVTKLVKAPITAAALFVPSTVIGGSPVHIKAGIEIKPPPPTTESMNEAIKPKKSRKPNVCRSNNSIISPYPKCFSPLYHRYTQTSRKSAA